MAVGGAESIVPRSNCGVFIVSSSFPYEQLKKEGILPLIEQDDS